MKFLTKITNLKLTAIMVLLFGFGALAANAQSDSEPEILVTKKGTEYQVVGWETNAVYNPDTYSFIYWEEPTMAKATYVKNENVPVSDFERPPIFDGICLTKENSEVMFECSTMKFNAYMADQSFDYPDKAQYKEDEGMAYVTFTLNKEGEMSRMQVMMKEACKGCAEEAAEIVQSTEGMWFPALMNGGKTVSTKLTVPIKFRIANQ